MAKKKRKGPKGTVERKILGKIEDTGEYKWVSPSEIALEGPIQHPALSPEQQAICKYTFARAGKYIVPNLEKWELGFMRDRHVDQELVFWLRVACVVDKLPHLDGKQIVTELVARCTNPLAEVSSEVLEAWDGIDADDSKRTVAAAMREAGLKDRGED